MQHLAANISLVVGVNDAPHAALCGGVDVVVVVVAIMGRSAYRATHPCTSVRTPRIHSGAESRAGSEMLMMLRCISAQFAVRRLRENPTESPAFCAPCICTLGGYKSLACSSCAAHDVCVTHTHTLHKVAVRET